MLSIDLHIHSTASDGTFAPAELARLARRRGVAAAAITDHDTVDGAEEFVRECARVGVRPIAGIELSASAPVTTHILGYRLRDLKMMKDAMDDIVRKRDERNEKMVKKLIELGLGITYQEVLDEAGGRVVARPHMASVLVKRGICANIREAFNKYLGNTGLAYVKRETLGPRDCIDLIRSAGGVAALAHPSQTGMEGAELDDMISGLKGYGLWGLECLSSHCSFDQALVYMKTAERHGLAVTAGSDFHGRNRPSVTLGVRVREDILPWARLGIAL